MLYVTYSEMNASKPDTFGIISGVLFSEVSLGVRYLGLQKPLYRGVLNEGLD